jgi:monovalent cation:H+ antiporter-2, CPA2 family
MEYLFIGLILFLFFLANFYFQKLHIPPLLAYIIVGLALSAFITGDLLSLAEHIGDVGIMFLFFLLGLHYPLNHLLNISRRIWQVGIMDVILSFGITFLLAYLYGFGLFASLILGGVAYASSSSITLKMLEDTGRSKTPEGEFKTGLLIFEDLVAPIMVSFLVGFSLENDMSAATIVKIAVEVLLLILASILISLYGFRRLELFVKRYLSENFMLIFVLAVAFIAAGLALSLGLSKLLGAFLAGVMIAETRSSADMVRLITPLKDATLPFFFFWFGTSITFDTGITSPVFLVIIILWGLAAKFLVGFFGGRMYGLTWKGSLRASFSLGQRGEFSVVIAALGDPFLRVFSGLFIIVTALTGVLLFYRAPGFAESTYRRLSKRVPRIFPDSGNR